MRKDGGADASIQLERVGMVYQTSSGPVEALQRHLARQLPAVNSFRSWVRAAAANQRLLRVIAGLRPATSGEVIVDGAEVTKPIANVGMVFQAPVLLKWRTILDNVLLPVELSGLPTAQYRRRAIGAFAARRPERFCVTGGLLSCRAACSSEPAFAARSCSTRRSY